MMDKAYLWVLGCIHSCEDEFQLAASEKLVELFTARFKDEQQVIHYEFFLKERLKERLSVLALNECV